MSTTALKGELGYGGVSFRSGPAARETRMSPVGDKSAAALSRKSRTKSRFLWMRPAHGGISRTYVHALAHRERARWRGCCLMAGLGSRV